MVPEGPQRENGGGGTFKERGVGFKQAKRGLHGGLVVKNLPDIAGIGILGPGRPHMLRAS